MVGQREVYARLEIAVDAARKRGEPLGHILFDGPPGLGKTTFATCIPRDLGVAMQIASGAALSAPKDLIPYLTNAEEGSVLFIDEIHRLPKAVEEFLYPAMEDFRIDIALGEGVNARTINMPLRPFTLIGATTRAGLLSAPLRDRFRAARASRFLHDRGAGRDRPPQRRQAASRHRRRRRRRDRASQPRHAAAGQQSPPLGARLRDQQGRRPHQQATRPGRARHARHRHSRTRRRRIANTWKRSSACFTADRWASKPWPTR